MWEGGRSAPDSGIYTSLRPQLAESSFHYDPVYNGISASLQQAEHTEKAE